MSTAAAAFLSCLVSWISAALGDGSPLGWLYGSLPLETTDQLKGFSVFAPDLWKSVTFLVTTIS
jgi:hypothetical protein